MVELFSLDLWRRLTQLRVENSDTKNSCQFLGLPLQTNVQEKNLNFTPYTFLLPFSIYIKQDQPIHKLNFNKIWLKEPFSHEKLMMC